LIKQGATLVQGVADILDGLSWEAREKLSQQGRLALETPREGGGEAGEVGGPMAGIAQEVSALLQVDRTTGIDEVLAGLPHRSSSEVIAVLFELELAGRIRQLPGRSYVKVWSE
jgi:DNA processing protein